MPIVLLLQSCVAKEQLSDAQIETIIYANQRFEQPDLPDGAVPFRAKIHGAESTKEFHRMQHRKDLSSDIHIYD